MALEDQHKENRVKTVGIIGGIGPESTVAYYRQIISRYRQRQPDGHYPKIIINSINMTRMLDLISAGRLNDTADYLTKETQKLAAAGADFAVLASNTPHVVFKDIQSKSRLPLISIIATTCREARRLSLKKVGLFGTKFTMRADSTKRFSPITA
jgi:aspartate racemase